MGPKWMVVAKHVNGDITITTYTVELEAREAFDILSLAPNIRDLYMGGVHREAHVRPEGVTHG